jgi:hypothetical protein
MHLCGIGSLIREGGVSGRFLCTVVVLGRFGGHELEPFSEEVCFFWKSKFSKGDFGGAYLVGQASRVLDKLKSQGTTSNQSQSICCEVLTWRCIDLAGNPKHRSGQLVAVP